MSQQRLACCLCKSDTHRSSTRQQTHWRFLLAGNLHDRQELSGRVKQAVAVEGGRKEWSFVGGIEAGSASDSESDSVAGRLVPGGTTTESTECEFTAMEMRRSAPQCFEMDFVM
jgi:hypothetical protein